MRPSFRALKCLVYSLGMASVFIACGGGPISIKGRIVDERGAPISKAEVATKPETDVVVSNSRGFFVLRQRITDLGETEPIKAGIYRLLVRKFGFKDTSIKIRAQGGKLRVQDLILKERTAEFVDTAPSPGEEQKVRSDETSPPKQGY
ncbi:MAG: carboxypeptidase-like regulatory domain-containing protein [Myxococcota bacterium]|nr:carboxypeptidase-like regulatory domain-containing protein [Myxococcota bacterium]